MRHDRAKHLEASGKARRSGHRELLRPPEDASHVAQDQHERIGQQQLVEILATVEMSQQQPLDHAAEHGNAQRGAEHREPETARRGTEPLRDLPRQVRPKHVERAVCEIQHAKHAEDHRKARGNDEQEHRRREAAQHLSDEERRDPARVQPSARASCGEMSAAFSSRSLRQRGTQRAAEADLRHRDAERRDDRPAVGVAYRHAHAAQVRGVLLDVERIALLANARELALELRACR